MAVSRIVFAIADLKSELERLGFERLGSGGDQVLPIELRLDVPTFDAVERELTNHFGLKPKRETRADDGLRGIARCIKFSGVRIVAVLPGNRWEI